MIIVIRTRTGSESVNPEDSMLAKNATTASRAVICMMKP